MSKITLLVLGTFLIVSCGGSSGGGSGSGGGVQGRDFTGLWRVSGVLCFNSSGAVTSTYNLAGGASTFEWTINGNNTTETYFNGSCRTNLSQTYVFTQTQDAGSGVTAGTTQKGGGTASITTGQGSCSYTYNITKSSGSDITPTTLSITYSNGQTTSSGSSIYAHVSSSTPPALLTPTILQVVGSPTDVCYLVFGQVS